MMHEIEVGEQTVRFNLLPEAQAGYAWRGLLLLMGKEYEVEIEVVETENTIGQVNWDKVGQVLRLIEAGFPALLEKASKNLRYFVKESCLFSSTQLEAIQFDLAFIEILHPLSPQLAFRLNFGLDPDNWIDLYGRWRVSFLKEHLVGVERQQL